MKCLPSLPVEFPNMLYIFSLWIKKKTERKSDFYAVNRAGKELAFFTLKEEVHYKPIETRQELQAKRLFPDNARPCAKGFQE